MLPTYARCAPASFFNPVPLFVPICWCGFTGFGRAYFKVAPDVFANDDAAYILAYSVIMLNTDRHNNQVGACCVCWGGTKALRCWQVSCQAAELCSHVVRLTPSSVPHLRSALSMGSRQSNIAQLPKTIKPLHVLFWEQTSNTGQRKKLSRLEKGRLARSKDT